MIYLYDSNNVMLRDLDKIGGERIGLRRRLAQCGDGNMHIWVWDGRNHNQRRRDIFPAYKANRTPMAEDRFAQIGMFRECLQHTAAIQVDCPGWEADDVIGALCHRFVSKGLSVTVHTNDLDYWQLMQYRGVTIDGIKPSGVPDCEPHHIPLYKALVGDKSDNIAGVAGFGPKSWSSLPPPDRKILQRAIDDQDTTLIHQLPLPTRPRNLLLDPANLAAARAALTITRFIPVPEPELDAGITQGVPNWPAADQILRKFFL